MHSIDKMILNIQENTGNKTNLKLHRACIPDTVRPCETKSNCAMGPRLPWWTNRKSQ